MAKKPEKQESQLPALKAAIKEKNPSNLYVFHGEEMFLLNHYLQQLKATVLDPLTESFNFHRFTQETFDLRTFADAVENMPMMAERTLVQVDDVDVFKLNEEARDTMAAILSDIPEYCTVIFVYETVTFKPDKRFTKLWTPFSNGQIVEFAKQNERDLMVWIQRHFLALGKRIEPKLCQYLLEITDGTMTSLGSEIKKIASYSGADTICRADIDAVTEPVLDAVVFRMTDQLSAGDYGAALITLQKLMKLQEEPLQILGAIGGHFRRISAAKTLLEHGRNAQELQKLCGIADFAARKAMEAARRCNQEYLQKAAELVVETDHKMKTSYDDPARLLELLILQLAMEGRHG
jgi:DNA polymerase-3 subunit delta